MFKIIIFISLFFQILLGETIQKTQIDIGILSFRDIDENNQRWEPLKGILDGHMKDYNITLHSLHQKDLDISLAQKKFDFIILHPQAFVEMETKYGIQNIASLVRKDKNGHLTTQYASTIVALKNSNINSLEDIKGKKIAIANKNGQAAYLIPKDALMKVGINIDKDCEIIFTELPMITSYKALQSGKADVAFFRSGYLEELIDQGAVKQNDLKVINQQQSKDFNHMHSTALYPEWSFAATSKADHQLIKIMTIALYSIKNANSTEFDSFSTPLSYQSTRELMQKYQIYPFNTKVTLLDFLTENIKSVISIFLVLIILSWFIIFFFFKSSQKMAAQAKQIKDILSTASDGIHIHDRNGKIILFSDSFHEMLGYTREEMNNLNVFDIDKYIDPEKMKFKMANLIVGKSIKVRTQHRKKDGTLLNVEIIAKLIIIDNKEFIYASSRDITDLLNHEKTLAMQNNELEAVFNTTKDGLAILGSQTNFLKVNNSYSIITGLTKDELLNTSCIELTLESDKEKAQERFNELLQKGYVDDFEKTCIIKGRKIVVSMSMSLLPDNNILTSIKDISNKKIYEEREKLAAMGEMIGNIAHQWRQPLSVITTIASGIKLRKQYNQIEGYDLDPDMDDIVKQGQYLSKTIDDFKNFIKNTNEKSNISIASTISKTVSLVSASLKNSHINTILEINDDCTILGYENELIQAFINFFNNAKDAIKENVSNDSDKIILISTKNVAEGLLLTIQDSGGGIPENVIHRIFEPYFTTKHQSVGTGLGLSMSYKIITERHHATISAENRKFNINDKVYTGACFSILFQATI